ncbi:EamA family transporter RarD [Brevibacillus fulvus]|uniref:Chloramphenicol-sensitive protein RarD n=1 Tax=Brevibacillus fulvus TaxID=1125967 RepID=A0A938XRB9_9BACL|nr:EamA family transporter RarD [Brevibacillus fulvus]MBM7588803.1 chloramphenicol-sensitive protein RarD [Brevibacillus fulvus]
MKQGVIYAVVAYLSWGLLPLYWKLFEQISALEILSHRIVWSFVFVAIVLLVMRRFKQMWGILTDWRKRLTVALSAIFITANWLIYIWAVNSGHVMETSLGYYMNPLVNVLFGVIFLKEKLNAGQWVAIALAALGVSIITVEFGQFPWISILLALSFAFYGLTKKVVKLDSLMSLAWETVVIFPIALIYLATIHVQHTDTAFSMSPLMILLLALTGVATALPLYWFAQATKTLSLTTVGFIQYLSPTTSLLLAIFVFKESFTTTDFISFVLIWLGLIVFTVTSFRAKQKAANLPGKLEVTK